MNSSYSRKLIIIKLYYKPLDTYIYTYTYLNKYFLTFSRFSDFQKETVCLLYVLLTSSIGNTFPIKDFNHNIRIQYILYNTT